MSQQSPVRPQGSTRSSKRTSPRGALGRGKPPTKLQSYLNHIADRQGDYVKKVIDHPLSTESINGTINTRKKTNIRESNIDYNGINATPNSIIPIDNTARVLFEKSPERENDSFTSPNRFREVNDSQERSSDLSNVVLEHTISKKGRTVQYVVKEFCDRNDSTFSVDVQSMWKRYSFNIPKSQVQAYETI